MCDGRDDDFDSGCGIKNTVTIDTDRHRERRKGQGGILAGGDFRQEIQPVPLELFSRKTLAQRRGKRLLSPPAQRRVTQPPKSRKTFWREEAQRNERALALHAGASDMELVPTIWRGAGSPFQRALPAGELSADSRGSAPPGASERSAGGCFRLPPRRAHDTLQPFGDESVIVGYTL